MSKSSTEKTTKIQSLKFRALSEFVQIKPIQEERNVWGIELASVSRRPMAKGEVLSVGEGRHLADGTLVVPGVKVGEIVLYNPHMVSYELKQEGAETVIVSSAAIYGKFE